MAEYEVRELRFPRGTTREEARALLTEHAEYGRWELARRAAVAGWPSSRLAAPADHSRRADDVIAGPRMVHDSPPSGGGSVS